MSSLSTINNGRYKYFDIASLVISLVTVFTELPYMILNAYLLDHIKKENRIDSWYYLAATFVGLNFIANLSIAIHAHCLTYLRCCCVFSNEQENIESIKINILWYKIEIFVDAILKLITGVLIIIVHLSGINHGINMDRNTPIIIGVISLSKVPYYLIMLSYFHRINKEDTHIHNEKTKQRNHV